ncbi:MAG TPA: cation diffusion facilitator family transporter [Blastocatellia bacterium]|nr:cation diffusion facilitator family transporter [Blastocatellia bacterium]HMX25482.1 cation diffusion facilitator family transporter [Blastocatellia bacterium]HMZ20075.1 cation diffusion facilitator family transporter [Blastocatellia bacterium]HNG32264.1 cation diffusion facilitator family transporter [Blastocatellia bacterium]
MSTSALQHHHHGHDHADHHHHSAHHHDHTRGASQRTLLIVLTLTFGYMIAEAIGGYLANSLALLSDAGHMFTDVAALALSLLAVRFASRPATPSKTYGFYRLEILAALANGVTLIVLSVLICFEAYERFRQPENVQGWTLVWISLGGLAVNIVSAWMLSRSHEHDHLNMRGAYLHVLGDLLGSVAAIAAGVLILWRGWRWADPLFSVIISLLIVYNSWRIVADAVNVLLEGAPSHINPSTVEQAIREVAGVRAIHDLHIWTITSDRHVLTAHIVVSSADESCRVLREVRALLAERFKLPHSTIQIEDPTFATVVNFKKRESC